MHSSFNKCCLFLPLLFFSFTSCKKDNSTINEIPELEFVNVAPVDLKEYQQPLVFTIHYKDGNGDLGENDANVKNVFLIDNRIGLKYEYRIQQLSPNNSVIPIEGSFTIELSPITLTDSVSQQNANFSIYVEDRAKNRSNIVTSNNVIIRK